MTEKRKRRAPALAARILTTGLSVSLSLGLMSAFAVSWKRVQASSAPKPPAVVSKHQIVYRYVHVPARAAAPARATTHYSTRASSTQRTTTPRTTSAPAQPRSAAPPPPPPPPPPATTTHGS